MTRLLACSGLAAAVAAGSCFGAAVGASQAPVSELEVRLGDKIRVAGAPLGCQVVRMRDLDGRIALDCRRAGALSGTYGTLLTGREAAVIRFQSRSKAKVILTATHDGGVR